jgi:hypothetical protein
MMGIGEQPGQFWPRQRGTAFVFNIPRRDLHPAFCGEGFYLTPGAGGVMFIGAGSEISADEADVKTLWFNKLVSMMRVYFRPSSEFAN